MSSSVDTLVTVLPAWRRSLRADHRRETTIASYELAATQLHVYLEEEGLPTAAEEITTDAIRGFTGSMLEPLHLDRCPAASEPPAVLQVARSLETHRREPDESPQAPQDRGDT